MSIESQHQQFVRDIRNGRAHAADLVGRYEPFTTSFGCVAHMVFDDDACPDCARRARERNEAHQVDRFRSELWNEQHDYDEQAKRDAAAAATKEARDHSVTRAPRNTTPDAPFESGGSGSRPFSIPKPPKKRHPVPEWYLKGEEPPGPYRVGSDKEERVVTIVVLIVVALVLIKFMGFLVRTIAGAL